MKISVFYKIAENPNGPKFASEKQDIFDPKAELARLKAELEKQNSEKPENIARRKELMRQIARLERFDRLQNDTGQKDFEAISKITVGKNADTIRASDILSLKRRGVPLGPLLLTDESNPDNGFREEVGVKYLASFGSNKDINALIGAGDILSAEVSTVKINGVEGVRKNAPRSGYYDGKGKYLPIFDGDTIEITAKGTLSEEDMKIANEAGEKRWKSLRIADIMSNGGTALTELQEDVALRNTAIEEKNKSIELLSKFTRSDNIRKASEFSIGKSGFEEIANSIGLDASDIKKVLSIMSAIGVQESRSNYGAQGLAINNPKSEHYQTRAIGRYQIMPNNWYRWSNQYFSETLDPSSPENQDKIAFARIGNYYLRHSRKESSFENIAGEIAQDWYGRGSTNQGPTTEKYRSSVLAIYKSLNNQS